MEWRRELDAGEAENQAAIARREGLTPVRVTQILALLRWAPGILDSIRALTESPHPPAVSESALRPITLIKDSEEQVAAFEERLRSAPLPNYVALAVKVPRAKLQAFTKAIQKYAREHGITRRDVGVLAGRVVGSLLRITR